VQARETLALADERGTIGSWSWRASEVRMVWSAGLYRLTGLAPSSFEPTLEACLQLIHPDDRPGLDWPAMLATEWLDDRVFRMVRPDGETRRVRVHGRTIRDDNDVLLGASGICIDVTDQGSASVREDRGLTHAQVRAARAYLGWTAIELAEKAGVSFSTVRRVEMPGHRAVRDANLEAIRDAFTRAGVVFVVNDDGSIGIMGR
jgi:hypothetical protein